VIVAPLLRVEIVHAPFGAGPFAAVIMTSTNAARALADHPRREALLRLPLFAVGRRSAAAAQAAGFSTVASADGNVNDLVRLIVARLAGSELPILYLAGEDRAADLGAELAQHDIKVTTVVVYRTVAETTLTAEAARALSSSRIDGVLHYSRRSAETFIACAKTGGLLPSALLPVHYCLSAEVAAPLVAAGATTIEIAEDPEESSLFNLLRVG
jgi:uroporphyrinogen-III synthase